MPISKNPNASGSVPDRELHPSRRGLLGGAAALLAAGAIPALAERANADFWFDCDDRSYPDSAVLKFSMEAGVEQIAAIWPRRLFGVAARLAGENAIGGRARCLHVAGCAFPSSGGGHRNRGFATDITVARSDVGQWQIRARMDSTWQDVEPVVFPPINLARFLMARDQPLPAHAGAIDLTGVLLSGSIDANRVDSQLLPGLFGEGLTAGRACLGFDAAMRFYLAPPPEVGISDAIRIPGVPGSFETLAFWIAGPDDAPGLSGSLHGYNPESRDDVCAVQNFAVAGWPLGSPTAPLRISAALDGGVLANFRDASTQGRARRAVTAFLAHRGAPQATVITFRWQPAEVESADAFGSLAVDWRQAGGIRSECRIPFSTFEILRQGGERGARRGQLRYRFTPAMHAVAVRWQDASFAVSALRDAIGDAAAPETLIEICAEGTGSERGRLTSFHARLAMHAARVQSPALAESRKGVAGHRPPPIRVQFVGADIAFWIPVLGPPPALSGGALVPLGPPATEGLMAHISLERAKAGSIRRINLLNPGTAVSGLTLNAFRRVPGHTDVRLVAAGRRDIYTTGV